MLEDLQISKNTVVVSLLQNHLFTRPLGGSVGLKGRFELFFKKNVAAIL